MCHLKLWKSHLHLAFFLYCPLCGRKLITAFSYEAQLYKALIQEVFKKTLFELIILLEWQSTLFHMQRCMKEKKNYINGDG